MENKTLLTVVALLMAGFVTIMLARGSDTTYEKSVFNTPAVELRQEDAATAPQSVADGRKVSFSKYDYEHGNHENN